MRYIKVILSDIKKDLIENWPIWASFTWFIGGTILLSLFRDQLTAIGLKTDPGLEPFAMVLLTIGLGIIGFIFYGIYEYVQSVIRRSNE